MKVKLGQLKTHLSRYLKDVRETGNPIEVCVREETVAYLMPSIQATAVTRSQANLELARALESDGIKVSSWGRKFSTVPEPGRCAAPIGGDNSVESIRSEKNW
jgi:antitoxin (DNA-binding transcriptional repressor) of toxin-antitoxin stability system